MAKIIIFDTEARTKMLKGVNTLANVVHLKLLKMVCQLLKK
jgi:hypothetical protein